MAEAAGDQPPRPLDPSEVIARAVVGDASPSRKTAAAPRLAVSLLAVGLVHPIASAATEAKRVELPHTPPPRHGDGSDDDMQDGLGLTMRAMPALDAAQRDAGALAEEWDIQVAGCRRHLSTFVAKEVTMGNTAPSSGRGREVMFDLRDAAQGAPVVERDPQFNYLRKWAVTSSVKGSSWQYHVLRDVMRQPGDDAADDDDDAEPKPDAASSESAPRAVPADVAVTWLIVDLADRAPLARNLEILDLSTTALTTLHMHALCMHVLPRTRSTITRLHLDHCGLTSESLMPLCLFLSDDPKAAALVSLSLAYNKICETGFKALERSIGVSGVTSLSLRANRVGSDHLSIALLHLLVDSKLRHFDIGFCGLGDSGIVKFCTVLRSRHCHVRSVNLDGANISNRVALLLLDTVCECLKLEAISLGQVAACNTPQYHARIAAALLRAHSQPPPVVTTVVAAASPLDSPHHRGGGLVHSASKSFHM